MRSRRIRVLLPDTRLPNSSLPSCGCGSPNAARTNNSARVFPMTAILQDPIFQDEAKAREWLEARVWPQGPVCPHCGVTSEHVTKLEGAKHRPGLYQCNECREQFTAIWDRAHPTYWCQKAVQHRE